MLKFKFLWAEITVSCNLFPVRIEVIRLPEFFWNISPNLETQLPPNSFQRRNLDPITPLQ